MKKFKMHICAVAMLLLSGTIFYSCQQEEKVKPDPNSAMIGFDMYTPAAPSNGRVAATVPTITKPEQVVFRLKVYDPNAYYAKPDELLYKGKYIATDNGVGYDRYANDGIYSLNYKIVTTYVYGPRLPGCIAPFCNPPKTAKTITQPLFSATTPKALPTQQDWLTIHCTGVKFALPGKDGCPTRSILGGKTWFCIGATTCDVTIEF